ncbi:MAG: hypothetical protein LBT25_10015 [Candidatus Symbiothrix sp.]|jgi:hypothetical protein|nr:hypothetical protein [Candidatus Symbiothrix sp.]
MKTFDLNAYGVTEMTQQEMLTVEGGNIFQGAWNWIKGAGEYVGAAAQYYWAEFCAWCAEQEGIDEIGVPDF